MIVTRVHGLVLLLAGAALVVTAMAGSRRALTARREADQDVAQLRRQLDSARTAHASSANAADSARLAAEVAEREYFLGRREYHLAAPMPSGAPWRRPFSFTTVLLGVGVLAVTAGAILARKAQRAA